MRVAKGVMLFVFFVGFLSCKQRDTLETRGGGYDYTRIPFIKPYEALRLNGSEIWGMNLYNPTLTSSIYNIKDVNIVNHMVLLHSLKTYLNGEEIREGWFVIIPSKHIEQGFPNHKEYVEFLNKNGLKIEPKLYTIDFINNYFEDHYPINWNNINQ